MPEGASSICSVSQSQQMKKASSFSYVLANLLAQGLHRRKFDFVAEPSEKINFDFRFWIQFDGMEVEQMGFDRKRLGAEGGTIADVGDGVEALIAHAGSSDVNAIFRNQFFIAAQIDGGNGVFGAVSAAPPGQWTEC